MADGGLANVFARNLTDVIPDLVGAGLVVVGLDAVAGFVGSVFVSSLTGLVGFIADFDPSAGWAAAGRGLGELDWRVCREDCNRSMRLISSDCCCGWMSPVRRAVWKGPHWGRKTIPAGSEGMGILTVAGHQIDRVGGGQPEVDLSSLLSRFGMSAWRKASSASSGSSSTAGKVGPVPAAVGGAATADGVVLTAVGASGWLLVETSRIQTGRIAAATASPGGQAPIASWRCVEAGRRWPLLWLWLLLEFIRWAAAGSSRSIPVHKPPLEHLRLLLSRR